MLKINQRFKVLTNYAQAKFLYILPIYPLYHTFFLYDESLSSSSSSSSSSFLNTPCSLNKALLLLPSIGLVYNLSSFEFLLPSTWWPPGLRLLILILIGFSPRLYNFSLLLPYFSRGSKCFKFSKTRLASASLSDPSGNTLFKLSRSIFPVFG